MGSCSSASALLGSSSAQCLFLSGALVLTLHTPLPTFVLINNLRDFMTHA